MNIYIASPFFNDEELEYLCEAEQVLSNKGLDVYSPMRHEDRDVEKTTVWSYKTFTKDVEAIKRADALVMLYHGNYSDSGTAWECGFAYAYDKPVIVVHLGGPSNLMVHEGCYANVNGIEGLRFYDFSEMPELAYHGEMI